MVKYLEPKYLKFLVIASVVAIVLIQATGYVPPMQTSAPPEHQEIDVVHEVRQRVEPIAGRPGRWDDQSRWR
jgi:hypothetical protein